MRLANIGGDFLALHHRLATLGERLFLAGLRVELGQFVMGVARVIGRLAGAGDAGALGGELRLDLAQRPAGGAGRLAKRAVAAIGVDQRAMGGGVEQRAFVVLAVDFDQVRRERAQRLGADALVVDEGAGAPVGELDAAQDQFALRVDVLGRGLGRERGEDGVAGRQIEGGGHLALALAVAHQRAVAARAQRQRQRVEQDRFAGAGLAGEDGQAAGELELQLVDQHDVADRKPGEHGGGLSRSRRNDGMVELGNPGFAGVPAATSRRPSAARRRPYTIGRRESCGRARRRRSAPRR